MHTFTKSQSAMFTAVLLLSACSSSVSRQESHSGTTVSSLSYFVQSSAKTNDVSGDVLLLTPTANDVSPSPIQVKGKARGNWFSEGIITVTLTDDKGKRLVAVNGLPDGEWMTNDLVDFSALLEYQTDAASGFIVVSKDNPSGLKENDAEVKIPVRFK